MKRFRFFALLVIFGSVASCARQASEQPRFSNLVLIVIDTLRSDHLPSYGYDRNTAPFIGRLAAEGIQVQGVSASSWTKPSVVTMLTGLHPQSHAVRTRDEALSDVAYLPLLLQAKGYSTAGYLSMAFAGSKYGFDRGYDQIIDVFPSPALVDRDRFTNPLSPWKPHGLLVTEGALALARELVSPWYLYVHYIDPHDPYTAKKTFSGLAVTDSFPQPRDFRSDPSKANAADIAHLIDAYDGTITEVDAAVRGLIEQLESRGQLDDTLVVLTSDHGEEFGEHGHLTHGKNLHEEVIEVPLIFWSRPGLVRWSTPERFHHVDLTPTLLEALGQDGPEDLDGVSRWRSLLESTYRGGEDQLHHLDLFGCGAVALVAAPFKLIHQRCGRIATSLFDLSLDPGETRSLDDNKAVRAPLLRRLATWHNELSAGEARRRRVSLDEVSRRKLSALGYLAEGEDSSSPVPRSVPSRLDLTENDAAHGSDR